MLYWQIKLLSNDNMTRHLYDDIIFCYYYQVLLWALYIVSLEQSLQLNCFYKTS